MTVLTAHESMPFDSRQQATLERAAELALSYLGSLDTGEGNAACGFRSPAGAPRRMMWTAPWRWLNGRLPNSPQRHRGLGGPPRTFRLTTLWLPLFQRVFLVGLNWGSMRVGAHPKSPL